jgi:hypothetical protein
MEKLMVGSGRDGKKGGGRRIKKLVVGSGRDGKGGGRRIIIIYEGQTNNKLAKS